MKFRSTVDHLLKPFFEHLFVSFVSDKEICPGPFIAEALPPTVETLSELAQEFPERGDIAFALGNILLLDNQNQDSLQMALLEFQRALSKGINSAELRCNLAITYKLLNQFDEALSQLKQAVLQNPSVPQVQLQLAQVYQLKGEPVLARAALEKLVQLEPSDQAFYLLGKLCEEQTDSYAARTAYQYAVEFNPHSRAGNRLAALEFIEQLKAVSLSSFALLGSLLESWGDLAQRYGTDFLNEQDVAQPYQTFISRFQSEKVFERNFQEFRSLEDGQVQAQKLPEILRQYYFSLGLFPEHYDSQSQLEQAEQRWRESIAREGDYPYARYRLGLIISLLGRLPEALTEFEIAHDRLPPKKQRVMKVKECMDFVRTLLRLIDEGEVQLGGFEDAEWHEAGFQDRFQIRPWKRSGLEPQESMTWKQAGFSAETAKSWSKSVLTPEIAAHWKDAGFQDAQVAKLWIRGNFTPEQAHAWSSTPGINPQLAIQCVQVGLKEPEIAIRWLKVFSMPWDAATWHQLGFTPEEAAFWLSAGIHDPYMAKRRTDETKAEESDE